jgi:hypothetical protein
MSLSRVELGASSWWTDAREYAAGCLGEEVGEIDQAKAEEIDALAVELEEDLDYELLRSGLSDEEAELVHGVIWPEGRHRYVRRGRLLRMDDAVRALKRFVETNPSPEWLLLLAQRRLEDISQPVSAREQEHCDRHLARRQVTLLSPTVRPAGRPQLGRQSRDRAPRGRRSRAQRASRAASGSGSDPDDEPDSPLAPRRSPGCRGVGRSA